MVRKYEPDPSHILEYELVDLRQDLTYIEHPVRILDKKEKTLRNKKIPLVKVLWQDHLGEEATWEREDEMKSKYPFLFDDL